MTPVDFAVITAVERYDSIDSGGGQATSHPGQHHGRVRNGGDEMAVPFIFREAGDTVMAPPASRRHEGRDGGGSLAGGHGRDDASRGGWTRMGRSGVALRVDGQRRPREQEHQGRGGMLSHAAVAGDETSSLHALLPDVEAQAGALRVLQPRPRYGDSAPTPAAVGAPDDYRLLP